MTHAHWAVCLRVMLMNAEAGESTCPPLLLSKTITRSPGFTVRTAAIVSLLHATHASVHVTAGFCQCSCNGEFIVKVTSGLEFPLLLGGVEGDVVWRHREVANGVAGNVGLI